jgi:transcriptional regulator with XRE-family HTH domain
LADVNPNNPESDGKQLDENKSKARDALKRRQDEDPSLTQAGLAEHLGITRASVSKILNSNTSHPMTIGFATGLAGYLNLSLNDIFGTSFFTDPSPPSSPSDYQDEAPEQIFYDSLDALKAFYESKSITPPRARLNELAELVANKIALQADPDQATYKEIIIEVLSQKAIG